PQHYRDMRKHHLVTGAVTLPIVVKTFDRVLQRGVIFKEAVHADDLENITQEGTHARELEIAIQVSEQLQPLQENADAQVVDMIHRLQIDHHLDPFLFDQRTDRIFDADHFPKINIAVEIDHGDILNRFAR